MRFSFIKAGLLCAAVALAGCNGTLEDIAPKAEKRLPPALVQSMKAKGMAVTAPIMVRIFKEEGVLEIWKQKDTGRYDIASQFEICKWSGKLGPKFTEGDRQAPEGYYTVRPHQMNPQSQYHLAFNMGYPNAFDRANNRTGSHLMVHGACSSAGCYSMTDAQVEQIYAFARDAFRGGQTEFQIQAFPFRMTAANMARYQNDPNIEFWKMLKEGYDHFEITRVPPRVDVCGRRYVFNHIVEDGRPLSPTAACPALTQPEALQTAYRSYQAKFETAFSSALGNGAGNTPPAPSIAGLKEAALVAEWSRRRARGERVTRDPPTLERPEIAVAATPAPAPIQAAIVPAEPPLASTVIEVPVPRAEQIETPQQAAAEETEPTPAPAAPSGLGGMRSRVTGGIRNLFGG